MAVPQVGGYYRIRSSASADVSVSISDVPEGGWMILSVMVSVSSLGITPPAGWVVIKEKVVSGTRCNFLFAKIKTAGDGATATFTQSAVHSAAYALLWGTGAGALGSWIVGTDKLRNTSGETSGQRYTNIAPSIAVPAGDHLVVAISNEATAAMVQQNEVASVNPSGQWNERVFFPQVAVNDRIETIWMGTKAVTSAGATGDVSIVYTSPQDSNGWAMQIAIPAAAEAPTSDAPYVAAIQPTTFIATTATDGFSINRPAGVVTGDYIVVALRGQSPTMTVAPSAPGFTRLGPAFVGSNSAHRVVGFYGHAVTNAAGEPTTYDFTFTADTASARFLATAVVVRGVDLSNPIAGFYDSYEGDTITNGRRVGSFTTNSAPTLQLYMAGSEFASPNNHVPLSLPSGYTTVQEMVTSTNTAISRTYLWLGSRVVSSTTTTPADITWNVSTSAAAESIALRGTNSQPNDPAGEGFSAYNGLGIGVSVYYTTQDGPRTPANILPMRRGFNSVTEMLATPGFTWAHRGGSASWPEMSLYAYTRSVARGYGVLEVSLARTSDGVWFGLHDQTTDRTSGGTYGNSYDQTWAQIQAQQIVVGAQGAPKPYMRWEEIVAAYGKTHLLVVDPKYGLGSYRTEFLNMVYNDVGPARAIIKYSGSGSGAVGLSNAAKAMGFETWGFFYAADASAALGGSGALQTWGPSWTLIGMDYTASQAVWDEALALGKPVIAHIVPTQSAYNTAIAKGAHGAQVSGVGVVAPVSWWT